MADTDTTSAPFIETVLKQGQQDITFEPIPGETDSPLAQPVIPKSERSGLKQPTPADTTGNSPGAPAAEFKTTTAPPLPPEPLDAPEQEIGGSGEHPGGAPPADELPEIPLSHATLMADTLLGVANNMLEVGGGYFVSIRKHKDFYEFEEVIQVIEDQNVRNIKHLKLDEEDKALLRPLLIVVLRKKAKVLTPEQQLLGACLSILMKKAKMVLEIRAENEILVERIREIVQGESTVPEEQTAPSAETTQQTRQTQQTQPEPESTASETIPASVLEMAEA